MKKKFTSVLLAVVLLFSNTLPAFASENQTTSEAGSKEATVLYDMSADYTITIPKKITLNSTKQSEYSVKVEGDIPSSERVYVSPVDAVDKEDGFNFYMQNQNENSTDEDVLATVTQSKVYWNFQDVSDGVEVTDNTVTAEDLKAGKWKGTFTFEINLKSVTSIDVTAKDSDGNDLNASAEAIIGEEKDNLLAELEASGLVDSASEVDALIDVKSDDFDDLADTVFDVSSIAQPGDKVVILHYDETKEEWEFIGEETVSGEGTVSGDFSSFSPVAFVKVADDGSYEHVHVYDENDKCACGQEIVAFTLSSSNYSQVGIPDSGDVVIPETFEYDGTKYKVTAIASSFAPSSGAFSGKAVTSVTIPDSVTSIGNYAFANSSYLHEIEVPDSVTTIGTNAFMGVNNVIYTGEATGSTWGANVVNGYKEGDFVYADSSKTTLCWYSGSDASVTIPDSVEAIDNYAFDYNNTLESITIGDNVTSMGDYVFDHCTKLSSVQLGNGITSYMSNVFSSCESLESIELPECVVSACFTTTGLREIYIPKGCDISNSYFSDPLEDLYYGGSAADWATMTEMFREPVDRSVVTVHLNSTGIPPKGSGTYEDPYNRLVVTKENVRSLGISLSGDVVIPAVVCYEDEWYKVTKIDEYTFDGCSEITSVTISEGIVDIKFHAFSNCTNLQSITIPSSVGYICDFLWGAYPNLSSIYLNHTSAPSLKMQCFSNLYGSTSDVTIYCKAQDVSDALIDGTHYDSSVCTKVVQ